MTKDEFNEKMEKSRLSAGWDHDRRHYHFQRHDNNNAPFTESESAGTMAEVLVCIVLIAIAAIAVVLVGGW